MRGHFRHLNFKSFSMSWRTPQGKVFWPLQSNSEVSGVSKESQVPISKMWVSSSHSTKNGVATFSPTRRKGQCPHWHLEFLLIIEIAFFGSLAIICQLCGWTLSQANLGVPKLPTFSWQVQEGLSKTLFQCFVKRPKLAQLTKPSFGRKLFHPSPHEELKSNLLLTLSYLTWLLSQPCTLITTIKP
jgi:hypothetical protein